MSIYAYEYLPFVKIAVTKINIFKMNGHFYIDKREMSVYNKVYQMEHIARRCGIVFTQKFVFVQWIEQGEN